MTYNTQKRALRAAEWKSILHHPYFGFLLLGLILLLVRLVLALGVDVPVSTMRAFGSTMIYIVIGLGFSILLGYAGLASLGTAGFVGVGSYLIGYLTNQMEYDVFVIFLISLAGAVLMGAIVGFISLRIEGMYLAIITLGLSEILNEVFKNATEITNGTNGLAMENLVIFGKTISLSQSENVYVVLILALVAMMILTLNIIKSPTGRAMLAMKNSESAAQAMGINVLSYRLLAFIVSTVYAFIGGMLYMSYYAFSIDTKWTLAFSLNILAAVVVGGPQSIFGIVLGTFMIFGLNSAVLQKIPLFMENPALTLVFNGLLIILVVMFYPGGLIRLVNAIKFKFIRWHQAWKEYRYGKDHE